MNHLRTLAAIFFGTLLVSGCDSSEPDDGIGEEELITRVVITLSGGGETVTAEASDPDGDGTDFQIDTISMTDGVTYQGQIELFDDPNSENVTDEIEAEAEEHQFFYTVAGGLAGRVSVVITDEDANGLPVGLEFEIADSGQGPASGTLRVVLSHYDASPKNGIDRSDETDVDVTFPVVIE